MPTISLNSQPWTITPIQWIAQFNVTVKYGNSHALHTSDYATLIGPTDLSELFALIAQQRVGNRPGRIEPRAIKRRPKPYPLLTKPRDQASAEVKKNGHPKKLK